MRPRGRGAAPGSPLADRRAAAAAPLAIVLFLLLARALPAREGAAEPGTSPSNLIFVLADDLGYGDLGVYGQRKIRTPRLDRMAAEGLRFTQFYAGATVCAPSRSVLMTGQHTGRTRVRGNAGPAVQRLRPEDVTVAEVLAGAGYATALCGKWGLGDEESASRPREQGCAHFFGYLDQTHAHNYYPEFLWRNEEKVKLRNVVESAGAGGGGFRGGWATKRVDYSHDLIVEDALRWVREHAGGPFFLYLALTIPHANNEGARATGNGQEVPDLGPYAAENWSEPDKGQAAMITRMDRDVGRLLDLLVELGLEKRTLVFFSSDNGHHREGGNDPDFFDANGPLRGMKRDLYEGGIRVPAIAWWPGTIRPGGVTDHLGYFGDLMATAGELAGAKLPSPEGGLQSVSLLPLLRGDAARVEAHRYLYWEFYERGTAQAVRFGRWKAVRKPMATGEIELYDLSADLGETRDIAAGHPEVVAEARRHLEDAHRPSPDWPARGSQARKPAGVK
jgi:uncharacterized sulfatase